MTKADSLYFFIESSQIRIDNAWSVLLLIERIILNSG